MGITEDENKNIQQVIFHKGERMKYIHSIALTKIKNLKGYIITANSDIFFDSSLLNIRKTSLSVSKSFYALLRFEFINNNLDKIISPSDIINNTSEAYVLGSLNSAIGTGDSFRADIASVIATRVINYCLIHSKDKSVTDAMLNRVIKLVTDCDSFTDDLKYFMVKEIVNGNKVKWQKLMMNSQVVKMAVK